jgi:hypothetical protein
MGRKIKVEIWEDIYCRYIDISFQPNSEHSEDIEYSEEDEFPTTEEFANALRKIIDSLAKDRPTVICFKDFFTEITAPDRDADQELQFEVVPPKQKK